MEKEFVPYEQALALKELGFNEYCLTYYNYDKRIERSDDWAYGCTLEDKRERNECLAPLYQQAFRWFREKYSLYATIDYDWNEEVFRVKIMKQNEDKSCNIIYLKEGDYIKEYKFHEEAELECLKKLIEIVKK